MHFTEIEMVTPTKISARNPVCRLCSCMKVATCFDYSARSAYLKICVRKFIKTGRGAKISEDDTRSAVS